MLKVCIIEDEQIIRKGLIASIDWQSLDCKVVGEAQNGEEGIKVIDRCKPDIILLDVNMPKLNGLDMLEQLPVNTYDVVILSGHNEFQYAKQAMKHGVIDYLLKPIDPAELGDVIAKIQRKHSRNSHDHPYHLIDGNPQIDSVTVSRALRYIQEHYAQKITLANVSTAIERSTTMINLRFKEELNMTFNDYLTKFRLQKAIELIAGLDRPLYEIATQVGFRDYKYFNSVFKKIVRVSPKMVQIYFTRLEQNDN